MSKDYTTSELGIMMKNLTEKVDTGFTSVHTKIDAVHIKQDKTNGNVKLNTEFRIGTVAQLTLIKIVIGMVGIGNILAVIMILAR